MERVFNPCAAARAAYVWDSIPLLLGVSSIVLFHQRIIPVLAGVGGCFVGLWMLLCTRNVLRTHFLVTDEQIASVGPLCSFGLRWDEISRVLVRERPSGQISSRPDRLVVLSATSDRRILFNTSVLSRADEEELLNEITKRIRCPIKRVTDGPFTLSLGGCDS